MTARRDRLIGAFTRRQIPALMLNWKAVSGVAIRAHDRIYRKRFPEHERPRRQDPDRPHLSISSRQGRPRLYPGFDIEALKHSFIWLPPPSSAVLAAERQQNLAWLRELLAVSLRMLPGFDAEDDAEVEGTPYEYDHWVFEAVATSVVQMTAPEDPGRFWRPILELGAAAHYWVETFLGAWTVSTLKVAPSVAQFFARWKEMIEFAMQCPAWMPQVRRGLFRLRRLWEHLLGMHLGASAVGAVEHQQYFADLIPLYRSWAERFLDEETSLRAYLRLLSQDGTQSLLCPSLPWLLRAAANVYSSTWADEPIADEIAAVLRRAWTWHGDSIASDADLQLAFSALLNLTVKHQSTLAMDLRDRVSRIGEAPSGR